MNQQKKKSKFIKIAHLIFDGFIFKYRYKEEKQKDGNKK